MILPLQKKLAVVYGVWKTLTSASKEFSYTSISFIIKHLKQYTMHIYKSCEQLGTRLSYSDPSFRIEVVWKERVKNQQVYHYTCKTNKLSMVIL